MQALEKIEKTAQKISISICEYAKYVIQLQVLKFHDKSPYVKSLQMWQCDDRCSTVHITIMGNKKINR